MLLLLLRTLLVCAIPGALAQLGEELDFDLADFDLGIVRCFCGSCRSLDFWIVLMCDLVSSCPHRVHAGSLDR